MSLAIGGAPISSAKPVRERRRDAKSGGMQRASVTGVPKDVQPRVRPYRRCPPGLPGFQIAKNVELDNPPFHAVLEDGIHDLVTRRVLPERVVVRHLR